MCPLNAQQHTRKKSGLVTSDNPETKAVISPSLKTFDILAAELCENASGLSFLSLTP